MSILELWDEALAALASNKKDSFSGATNDQIPCRHDSTRVTSSGVGAVVYGQQHEAYNGPPASSTPTRSHRWCVVVAAALCSERDAVSARMPRSG